MVVSEIGEIWSPQTAPARIEAVTIVSVHIFSADHRKCNRKQNTEGTPGRTGRERQPRRDDEHQGRHQGADQRIAAHYLFDIAADV